MWCLTITKKMVPIPTIIFILFTDIIKTIIDKLTYSTNDIMTKCYQLFLHVMVFHFVFTIMEPVCIIFQCRFQIKAVTFNILQGYVQGP